MSKSSADENLTKESFLQAVCNEIHYKKVHPVIAKEFENHIDELATDLMEAGNTPDDAYRIAIERMGDPAEIGIELNKTYKPLIEWSVLFLTASLVGVGIFILQFINNASGRNLFNHQTLVSSTSLGIVALIAVLLFDYKKLEKLSFPCYVLLSIALLLFSIKNGRQGIHLMGLYIHDIPSLLVPFLIVSFAGVVTRFCTGKSEVFSITISISNAEKQIYIGKALDFLIMVGLAGVPIFSFLIMPRFAYTIILGVIFFSMITYGILQKNFQGDKRKYIRCLYGGGLFSLMALVVGYTSGHPSAQGRLKAMLNPYDDPMGYSYHIIMARKFIHSAKLFGETSVLLNQKAFSAFQLIPEPHNDFVFTTIVATFGWVFASMVVALLLLFVWRIMASSRKISDDYGRILTIGICAAFAFQIVMSILINISILPPVSISLPFLSYGGSGFICNMVLVGLLLSVYRRKNLVIKTESAMLSK